MQGSKTLAFFSKKLTDTQKGHGVGEREMLSIVEALKEFRTMIYGYPIDVYTDHLNWTHGKAIRNEQVMRWRPRSNPTPPQGGEERGGGCSIEVEH